MSETELYYRYREMLWTENKISLNLLKFPVLSRTPKGVWIEEYIGKKRFVLKSARKKFACATEEEALESFRARKKREIKILKNRLARAEAALKADPKDQYIYFGETFAFHIK